MIYLGDFANPWSTENDLAEGFEAIGRPVVRIQEESVDEWEDLNGEVVLWTTRFDVAYRRGNELLSEEESADAIQRLLAANIVVGYHLDRFHGLRREELVTSHPFFHARLVITADGGSDWHGVDHLWLSPAVSRGYCTLVDPVSDDAILFIGSRSYHPEWPHRGDLIAWVESHGGEVVDHGLWGERLTGAVAGRIVIGDSCMLGPKFWSDRIPSMLGRGALLIHPELDFCGEYEAGRHLVTWKLGDWDDLARKVDYYRRHPRLRRQIASAGRTHVLEHHTYERRAEQILHAIDEITEV